MQIWPFQFLRAGFSERPAFRVAVPGLPGRRVVQRLHAASELVVSGRLLFPQTGGTWSTFYAWWIARQGPFEAFLYQPQSSGAADVADAFSAAAAQVDFDLTRRYVETATVVVKKAGVTQTLGVHYTLTNGSGGAYVLSTSPKLTVRFGSAPGPGVAVTVDYKHYVPVRFEGDDLLADQEIHAGGGGGAAVADRTVSVQLRETGPGYSYAAVPDSV